MATPVLLKTDFRPLASFTFDEAADVLGCPALKTGGGVRIAAISTDSRTLREGEVFLALRGENFDGHEHLAQAISKGAAGLIIDAGASVPVGCDLPILKVPDALTAYGDLARHLRATWPGKVTAISGSVGKTTTRRLVAHALRQKSKVLEPIKNFNNLIGLPKTLLELEKSHEVAVLELGMNLPGELARLTEIASPDVACLTQIGRAHLGQFENIEALAAAKLSLFRTSRADCALVVNLGCAYSSKALEELKAHHKTITFRAEHGKNGQDPGEVDVYLDKVRPAPDFGIAFDLTVSGERHENVTAPLFGMHQSESLAAAAAILLALGEDAELFLRSLDSFKGEPLRAEIAKAGGATFILDCYNAAPEAMGGALESLAVYPWAGRRILVLADMLELGDHSGDAHNGLLAPLERLAPDFLFTLGPEMARIGKRAGEQSATTVCSFDSRTDLQIALEKNIGTGDLIFVKGARGFELEKVVQPLIEKG